MFRLVKKIVVLILMNFSSGIIIKNINGNFMLIPRDNFSNKPNCFSLKNQECKVRMLIMITRHILIKLKLISVLEVVMIKTTLILKFVYQILLKILVQNLLI